jgi:AbrB family transcriptional regulator, stage V sporulation protein T
MTYHAKLIKGGKIVIPVELRREMGFEDGDTLVFEREGGKLVLKTFAQVVHEVQESISKLVKPGSGAVVDELIAERRAEAARD